MKVSGIFKTLITIVACVVIGALVLNILLPNVTSTLINATEGMIYQATRMSFDFNGDGTAGEQNANSDYRGTEDSTQNSGTGSGGAGVDGFGFE